MPPRRSVYNCNQFTSADDCNDTESCRWQNDECQRRSFQAVADERALGIYSENRIDGNHCVPLFEDMPDKHFGCQHIDARDPIAHEPLASNLPSVIFERMELDPTTHRYVVRQEWGYLQDQLRLAWSRAESRGYRKNTRINYAQELCFGDKDSDITETPSFHHEYYTNQWIHEAVAEHINTHAAAPWAPLRVPILHSPHENYISTINEWGPASKSHPWVPYRRDDGIVHPMVLRWFTVQQIVQDYMLRQHMAEFTTTPVQLTFHIRLPANLIAHLTIKPDGSREFEYRGGRRGMPPQGDAAHNQVMIEWMALYKPDDWFEASNNNMHLKHDRFLPEPAGRLAHPMFMHADRAIRGLGALARFGSAGAAVGAAAGPGPFVTTSTIPSDRDEILAWRWAMQRVGARDGTTREARAISRIHRVQYRCVLNGNDLTYTFPQHNTISELSLRRWFVERLREPNISDWGIEGKVMVLRIDDVHPSAHPPGLLEIQTNRVMASASDPLTRFLQRWGEHEGTVRFDIGGNIYEAVYDAGLFRGLPPDIVAWVVDPESEWLVERGLFTLM